MAPTGFETLGLDTGFDRSNLFDQVQGKIAEEYEVFRAMVFA